MEHNVSFENLPKLMEVLINKVEALETTLKNNVFNSTSKNGSTTDRWLNLEELRDYLPDHPAKATIYGWVSTRLIPHHKGGKRLRFRQSEIDKWITDGKRKSETELTEQATKYLAKQKGGARYE